MKKERDFWSGKRPLDLNRGTASLSPLSEQGCCSYYKRETLDFKNDHSGSLSLATIGSGLVGFSPS